MFYFNDRLIVFDLESVKLLKHQITNKPVNNMELIKKFLEKLGYKVRNSDIKIKDYIVILNLKTISYGVDEIMKLICMKLNMNLPVSSTNYRRTLNTELNAMALSGADLSLSSRYFKLFEIIRNED